MIGFIQAADFFSLSIAALIGAVVMTYFFLKRKRDKHSSWSVGSVAIAGHKLCCSHCQSDLFFERKPFVLLRAMSSSPHNFVCAKCGHVHSFAERNEEVLFVRHTHLPSIRIEDERLTG